jgi:hypothetical protein
MVAVLLAVNPEPVSVTVVPGGPVVGYTLMVPVNARAGVAGMASISRERVKANPIMRRIPFLFIC